MGMALAAVLVATLGIGMAAAAGKGGSGGRGGSGKSGGHHSGKSHSGHHHNRSATAVGVGVVAGSAWWPWWNYPAYYPPIAVDAVPVGYIERSEQETQAPGEWLYCARAQAYFPYVSECADGWERVPAAPLK